MSKVPPVSIIMPVYNAGQFLHQAVQSIFAQTFTDWELIAIDDASTDDSWEYLQRIDDPRVHLARNDRNMNQSFTQNRGIDLASGKWIVRMDADDIMAPTRIEKQIKALEADPQIDVLGCGMLLTDKELNLVMVDRPPTTHDIIARWPSINFFIGSGVLAGKIEWFRTWRSDPRIRFSQDFDLLFRAHRHSVFANIPEPLYVYRFIGHTRTLGKQYKGIYYKAKALLLNGFRMGMPFQTLLGLASLAPRPLLQTIIFATGGRTAIQSVDKSLDEADIQSLNKILHDVEQIEVPHKSP